LKDEEYNMKFKLLCCEVFVRETCIAIAASPHTVDPEFSKKNAHEKPYELKEMLQKKINETHGDYDAILLGYGLCGNSIAGITAMDIPVVIPRAHDCCTIFLGSKEKFVEHFKDNLSREWSSAGYMERGDSYLRDSDTGRMLGLDQSYYDFFEKYGEENAEYLWETLHPKNNDNEIIYIDIPETSHLGYCDKLRNIAKGDDKNLRVIEGNMRLIDNLIKGIWNEDEFLLLKPGQTVKPCYDFEKVIDIK
jgi:hypothetical protein